jgi:ribA/ribD-fused uncharacterized protein
MKFGIYRHYKGKEYEVINIAKDTETLEDYVVYRALYDNEVSKTWIRKLDEFNEKVVVDGIETPRFTFVSDTQSIKFKGGGYNVLSNFSAFKISYKNQEWMTSEHAYQAAKFLDKDIQEKIQQTSSAYDAKMLALEYSDHVREDWIDINVIVMKEIITEKAKQYPYIQKKLLTSGNLEIIEDTDDEFWGRGESGLGKNMLGQLWMEVREELQEEKFI